MLRFSLGSALALGLLLGLAGAVPAAERVRYHEVNHNLLVLGDPADSFIAGARLLVGKEGYFDLVGHGNPVTLGVHRGGRWIDYDARDLARFIRRSGWNGTDKIRFVSCRVGCGVDSLAERLANELEVPVLAPKGYAWADEGLIEIQRTLGGQRLLGRQRYGLFVPGRGDVTLPGNRLFRNLGAPRPAASIGAHR